MVRDAKRSTDGSEQKRKQRIRSPHPGVVLQQRSLPSGNSTWRARFVDPDSGRTVYVSMDRMRITNAEGRRKWAMAKSRSLNERRAELASGAPRRTETALKTVRDAYLKACEADLRPRTIESYEESLDLLAAWVKRNGPQYVEDFDRSRLAHFREHIRARKRTVAVDGGRRGSRRPARQNLAPASVNRHLRHIKTFFNHLRVLGHVPRLDRDAISDALRSVATEKPQARPMVPRELRALLKAALKHDLATYKLTRKEHAAQPSALIVRRTNRYDAISPLLMFVLFTGCRIGEALKLRWRDVDLEARDNHNVAVGEIVLTPTATKTRAGRRIDLAMSPMVRDILLELDRARRGPYVFGGTKPMPRWRADGARRRLVESFRAPEFNWQQLRQTTASYLTNAPGIFGAASVYRSAQQLGHSPAVAQRHYLDVVRGISPEARTIESAMRVQRRAAYALLRLRSGLHPRSREFGEGD